MSVDLHLHTSFSDGTDTPEILLRNLQSSFIKHFAICDHDTVDGCKEFKRIAPDAAGFICGVEFSCRTEYGKCHILGLGIDICNKEIDNVVSEGKRLRSEKLYSRLNHLKSVHNIVFSENEISELKLINSVGKPHLARLIVKHGYSDTIDDAIKNYLTFRGNNDRLDAKLAVDAIKSAGGIVVWAHPLGGEGEKRLSSDAFEKQLMCLTKIGIDGLECYYSRYTSQEAAFLVTKADEHGLYISGGSDYHGSNKNISIGELSCDNSCISEEQITVLTKLQ